jgi:hypothetical protein
MTEILLLLLTDFLGLNLFFAACVNADSAKRTLAVWLFPGLLDKGLAQIVEIFGFLQSFSIRYSNCFFNLFL